MRTKIREKMERATGLLRREGSEPVPGRDVKKAMKLYQRSVKLAEKLDLRVMCFEVMINFYDLAVMAREMGITSQNEPEFYKQECLKYAKIFGDGYIYDYNKRFNVPA